MAPLALARPQNGEMVDLEYQKIICIADREHALVYEQASSTLALLSRIGLYAPWGGCELTRQQMA